MNHKPTIYTSFISPICTSFINSFKSTKLPTITINLEHSCEANNYDDDDDELIQITVSKKELAKLKSGIADLALSFESGKQIDIENVEQCVIKICDAYSKL